MLSRKLLLPLAVAGLLGGLFASASAQGTIPDQPVYFTFSAPVSLPGATLPAGQYEFKLSTSQADRHIIQVYSRDTNKSVGMFFARASIRAAVPEKPEVTFLETPSNMPPAVQTWWYPGITTGHEFIYPREQAVILAKSNPRGVLTTEGDAKSGSITRLTASGETAVSNDSATTSSPAPAAAPGPRPAPARMAMTSEQAQATAPAARRALPRTASELPAMAAAGLVSLMAGLALMRRRRIA